MPVTFAFNRLLPKGQNNKSKNHPRGRSPKHQLPNPSKTGKLQFNFLSLFLSIAVVEPFLEPPTIWTVSRKNSPCISSHELATSNMTFREKFILEGIQKKKSPARNAGLSKATAKMPFKSVIGLSLKKSFHSNIFSPNAMGPLNL